MLDQLVPDPEYPSESRYVDIYQSQYPVSEEWPSEARYVDTYQAQTTPEITSLLAGVDLKWIGLGFLGVLVLFSVMKRK